MKKLFASFLSLFLLSFLAMPSAAQFEGKIVYNTYDVSESGSKSAKDRFQMYVTPERILFQGDKSYDFNGFIQTTGLLVRLDFEDFVFLTGKDNAMKISKSDITNLMDRFGGDAEEGMDDMEGVDWQRTGEQKTIKGYSCEKFIFSDNDGSGDYAEVWMTRDVDINWGMLAEPWSGSSQRMLGEGMPFNLVLNEGYFPLEARTYDEGRLTGIMEASEVSPSSIARAMVQIPSGVKVLGFGDYLFQNLSKQQ